MTDTTPHPPWGAQALWEGLSPLLPGIRVEVLPRVESTNARLLERARSSGGDADAPVTGPGDLDALSPAPRTPHGRRAGDIAPTLLVAEQQTRGRGRLGRSWVSSAGASLTFSLALPLAPANWVGLSLAVGLALAEALDPLPAAQQPPAWARIALKWPNDLWLQDGPGRGRKLGGVLIELISVGDRRLCVVGVGLNVLPLTGAAIDGLTHGYACLQEIDPQASAPGALARVAVPLVRALQHFESHGFAPRVQAYAARDLLRGQAVSTTAPQPLQGVAQGVDEQGALLVRTAGGEVHHVVSGEVSVRLGAG